MSFHREEQPALFIVQRRSYIMGSLRGGAPQEPQVMGCRGRAKPSPQVSGGVPPTNNKADRMGIRPFARPEEKATNKKTNNNIIWQLLVSHKILRPDNLYTRNYIHHDAF